MKWRDRMARVTAVAPPGVPLVLLAGFAKGIAFLREPVVAAVLGASASSDAYYIAVGLPLALYNLFALPYSQWVTAHLAADGPDGARGRATFGRALWVATAVSVGIAMVLALCSPIVVRVYAPGLMDERLSRAVQLLRVGALAVPALVLQAVCAGRLYAERRFTTVYTWIAAGSVVGFAGVLALTPRFGALGGVVAFLASWWTTAVALLVHRRPTRVAVATKAPEAAIRAPGIDLGVVSRAVVMQVFFQGSALLVYAFASRLNAGEIAATLFASKIVMAVYETVVLTAGVLVFPEIARALSLRNERSAGAAVMRALTWVVPVTVVCMLLLAMSRTEIVTLVYRRHAFDRQAVSVVSSALLGYAPYVAGITLVEILHRAMVLRGRVIGYVAIFGGALAGNWVACWVLVPRLGVVGVTIGASLGILLAGIGLWLYAHVRLPQIHFRVVALLLARTVMAGAVAAGAIALIRAQVHAPATTIGYLSSLAVETTGGLLVFGASLLLLGYRWPELLRPANGGAAL